MKYLKSTNAQLLGSMPLGRMRLHVGGQGYEQVWVKRDYQADKSYLQESSKLLQPFPSWGLEIPTSQTVYDLSPILTENPQDLVLTVHSEMYDQLLSQDLIGEDSEFNWDRFVEMNKEEKEAKEVPKEVASELISTTTELIEEEPKQTKKKKKNKTEEDDIRP